MIDELLTPQIAERRQIGQLRRLRTVSLVFLILGLVYTITLFWGVNAPELPPVEGARISFGLCLAIAIGGSILGFFLALIPFTRLSYLHQLPVASLLGMVMLTLMTGGYLTVAFLG